MRTSVALAFLIRDFKVARSYRVAFLMQLGGIFVAVPIFYFMGDIVDGANSKALKPYGGNYFAFLLIGVALLDYLAVSLRSFGNSLRESQLTGTLEFVLLSPTSLIEVLLYSSIWIYLFTTLRFILYLALGSLFELELQEANMVGAILVLLIGILSFIPFGVFTASLIMIIKRGEMLNTLIAGMSLFFGGVLFPVESLNELLQLVSKCLPFTYALEGMRQAIQNGATVTQLLPTLAILGGFAAILLPLSFAGFGLAVRHTRRSGSLGQY